MGLARRQLCVGVARLCVYAIQICVWAAQHSGTVFELLQNKSLKACGTWQCMSCARAQDNRSFSSRLGVPLGLKVSASQILPCC